jgi:hypothetical protein
MRPRAFIIHGYQGYPAEAWQPWLKAELEKKGYAVALPAMPHPNGPTVAEWTDFIAQLVGEPDRATVLIAHSLGGHAVLRYLEGLGRRGQAVGKTVLVACTFPGGLTAAAADQKTGGDAVLRPWLMLRIDSQSVQKAAGKGTLILSDNDPYIPFTEARASFAGWPDLSVVVEPGQGHFNEDDKLTELPAALAAVLA